MSRMISIHWGELSKLSSDTLDLVINLEKARLRIKAEIDTLSDAWDGYDALNFKAKYLDLDERITSEIKLLLAWSDYFKDSSKSFSDLEEESARDVDTLHVNLENACKDLIHKEDGDDV